MTLADYIKRHGTGAKRDLAKKSGLRWATIHDIARGHSIPLPSTAKKIAAATGGEVSEAELLGIGGDEAAA